MSATILEGPAVAEAISKDVMQRVEALKERGVTPQLAIMRVGERPDDLSYERGACKRAELVGVAVRNLVFDEDATTDELVAAVESVNGDDAVHGLLILRPLPAHIDEERVCNALATYKDVDACNERSLGAIFTGSGLGFAPCTAQACNLRDNYSELRKAGYEVIGVSVDNEKSHQKFIEKNNLPFPLIADTDKKLVEQFGVWGEKSMYGRKYMGTFRTTFIINEEGVIERIITPKEVKTKDHAAQIL